MTQDVAILTDSPSRTYVKRSACLTLYITAVYKIDEPDKIDYIKIAGHSGVNNCGNSWLEMTADHLTFCIRRIRNHHDAVAIVKNCIRHRCNNIVANKEHIVSCADAIGRATAEILNVDLDEAR